MTEGISAALIIFVAFYGISIVIKAITSYQFKKSVLNSGSLDVGNLKDTLSLLESNRKPNKENALKWGLIMLFGGAGLIWLDVYGFDRFDENSLMTYGIELAFIAGGFLSYFFILKSQEKKALKNR
ncbi:hypothetical protein [Xanthovirga aplysinae]|uniref:hypothetical protein n=1 Tax=Xanthovirga aplysinae TaxID=2529853 RepID=UPI0012BCB3F9|nr:hypothetical protein [Xanthovirga aplysinae]MTI32504.1 hypothetical protein [Xanthovirga aplysinae]